MLPITDVQRWAIKVFPKFKRLLSLRLNSLLLQKQAAHLSGLVRISLMLGPYFVIVLPPGPVLMGEQPPPECHQSPGQRQKWLGPNPCCLFRFPAFLLAFHQPVVTWPSFPSGEWWSISLPRTGDRWAVMAYAVSHGKLTRRTLGRLLSTREPSEKEAGLGNLNHLAKAA